MLVQAGFSFSGGERHCAFLNTRGPRFANISTPAGFDFPEDGRALALADWDQDGDVDVWVANRTGPQVRVLRNDTPTENHFVAVRLEGRSVNRDAIGARVEIVPAGPEPKPLIKTLRAGEGFLGQSSKWLHFGLGDVDRIERFVVHWPGAEAEIIPSVAVDGHYRIVQGSGAAEAYQRRQPASALRPSRLPRTPVDEAVRKLLAVRIPLPDLEYATLDGQNRRAKSLTGKPLLLNLWASWCPPCVAELTLFTKEEKALRDAGVEVLAVSVDALGQENTGAANASPVLSRMGFPFLSGMASPAMVDKLQIVHDTLWKPHRPLPVPTSFLFDVDGRLAAIYKGPVGVADLMADVRRLALEGGPLVEAALPFPGRWFAPPQRPRLLPIALQMVNQNYLEDALAYTAANEDQLVDDGQYADLLFRFGKELLDREEPQRAAEQFRKGLALDPEQSSGYYNLGAALSAMGDLDGAIEQYRNAVEKDPTSAAAHFSLAGALENKGQTDEAIDHLRLALQHSEEAFPARLKLANLLLACGDKDQAVELLRQAAEQDIGDAQTNVSLGRSLVSAGQQQLAMDVYRRALRMDPDHADAHSDLASLLASGGDVDAALRHLRRALEITPRHARAHANLGIIRARQGRMEEAVSHFEQAVRLDPGDLIGSMNLSAALSSQGRYGEAAESLRAAVEQHPDNAPAHYRLAIALAKLGDIQTALNHFRRAAEIRPDWLPPVQTLAWLLATHPSTDVRNADESVKYGQRALEIAGRQNAAVLDALAAGHALAGDFERAASLAQEAIDVLKREGTLQQAGEVRRRLELYQQRKPYVQDDS